MLKEGDKAPAFALESDAGSTVKLADLRGRRVVLYFYPKDNTPGCTREAQAFAALAKDFAKVNAAVFGVSRDSIKSHCSFRDKYGLTFPLLSDPSLTAHKAFGAFGKKMMYGREVEGTIRSTFVIGTDGTLERVYPNVKVDGHAEAVLAYLRGNDGAAAQPAKNAAAPKVAPEKVATKKVATKKVATKGVSKKAATTPSLAPKAGAKKTSAPAPKKGAAGARGAKAATTRRAAARG